MTRKLEGFVPPLVRDLPSANIRSDAMGVYRVVFSELQQQELPQEWMEFELAILPD